MACQNEENHPERATDWSRPRRSLRRLDRHGDSSQIASYARGGKNTEAFLVGHGGKIVISYRLLVSSIGSVCWPLAILVITEDTRGSEATLIRMFRNLHSEIV